jgi:ATP-dependent DNA helicase RecG
MNEKGKKVDWNQLVQRESARVEWKENVANLRNVVKTLCAFANDFQQVGGGRVLCGLREEKDKYGVPVAKVVGLDEKRFKEVKNKVLDYCHRYVDPPLTPGVSEYPVENDPSRRILVFAVTSSQYAHRYRTKKDDVNYYIRVNDETRPADGLIPQLLELKKIWPPYLDQTHPGATLEAVDLMALKEFLGRLNLPQSVEKYLEPNIRFRGDVHELVTYPPGHTDQAVPRNFTLLLFGREPHIFFRGAYAIFSVYHGKDRASKRSQRYEVFGPIPAMIRNLMSRLQLYMGMEIDKGAPIASGNRNRYRFSELAVQEAIVNAFVHRDYHSYDPVRITVFEDRIEIISPGGVIAPIDPEKIRKGEVYMSWRNPSLAWFMVELEFAQNEGQGIITIIQQTKNTSGKEPQFRIEKDWFTVVIPAYVPLTIDTQQKIGLKSVPDIDVHVHVNIRTDLPSIQSDFEELKDVLAGADAKLDNELDKVGDYLDALNFESNKEELVKVFNKLGRLLKKLGDESFNFYKILKGTNKAGDTAQKLLKTYNKFAQWLALPKVSKFL